MVNLFKSGEVVLADGGRGTTQAMTDDGLPVEWIAPTRVRSPGSVGSRSPRRRRTLDAAYKLIDYYASPEAQAISAEMGFVAMNPDALESARRRTFKESADPSNLESAIPQTEPENAEVYDRAWQEVRCGAPAAGTDSRCAVGGAWRLALPAAARPRWSRS